MEGKKSKTRVLIIVACALTVVCLTLGGIIYYLTSTYKKAVECLNKGDYDTAKATFTSISDYKDSFDMVFECDYRKAASLLDGKSFDEAKILYSTISGYKDSKLQMPECDYKKALFALEEKRYDDAKQIFESMGDYGDAKNLVVECDYRKLCDRFDTVYLDDYAALVRITPGYINNPGSWTYTTLPDENAGTKADNTDYTQEEELRKLFIDYEGYSDSENRVKKLTEEIGSKLFIAGNYEKAKAEFDKFSDDPFFAFLSGTCEMEMLKKMFPEDTRYQDEIGKRLAPLVNDSVFLDYYFGADNHVDTGNCYTTFIKSIELAAKAYNAFADNEFEIRLIYFDDDDTFDAFYITYYYGDPTVAEHDYSEVYYEEYYANGDYISYLEMFDIVDNM